MITYLFAYHGGEEAQSPKENKRVMATWTAWFQDLGDAVIARGGPVGISTTVHSDRSVTDYGGRNPVSGYSLIRADSIDAAIELAKRCPILKRGGSIEIAPIIDL